MKGAEVLAGVPVSMTKPEFLLTEQRTAPAAAKYSLAVEWVADPEEQYVVNIDPCLFSEIDFGLTFGPHGEATEATVVKRDQIGPTVVALGEFAASLIGAGSKLSSGSASVAAFVPMSWTAIVATIPNLRTLWHLAVDASQGRALVWDTSHRPPASAPLRAYRDCPAPANYAANHWRVPTSTERTELQALLQQLAFSSVSTTPLPFSLEKRLWLTTAERMSRCTRDKESRALGQLQRASSAKRKTLQQLFPRALGEQEQWSADQRTAFVALLDHLNGDSSVALTVLLARVDAVFLGSPSGQLLLPCQDVVAAQTAVAAAERALSQTRREIAFLETIAGTSDSVRLGRVVALEEAMSAARRSAAGAGSNTPDPRIPVLYKKWLVAIDAYEEGRREELLLSLLGDPVRPPVTASLSSAAQARAAQDYAVAAEELAKVRALIAQKRSALSRSAAAPSTTRSLRAVSYAYPYRGASTGQWVQSVVGLAEPEFVIVLERGYAK
ncbi:MAG: hypothetical protein AAF581_15685 [Planctomycetota bacterium]